MKCHAHVCRTLLFAMYRAAKALHDRIGSRSNDDLDHILGKKDRNWLNF